MIPAQLIRKLLAMDGEEVRFRASVAVRRETSRLGYLARRPTWRREALVHAIRGDDPSLAAMLPSLRREDWIGAHESLMHHFATRAPRFVLDPKDRANVVAMMRHAFPGAGGDAVHRADAIVSGAFDLLGYTRLSFSNGAHQSHVDWHFDPVHDRRAPQVFWSRVPFLEASCGDHKIVWELNRHQYWLALGRAYWLSDDRKYRDTFVEHFCSWMDGNPPLSGTNWASMLELGLRAISWVWALHFFALPAGREPERSPWTVDMLIGLDRKLTLVEQNLSRYFSPNTHLLGEALALYVVGRSLPELRRAPVWERLGRSILLKEITRQINGDGGHAELSTHYHRYTLDFYLLALAIARRTGDAEATPFAQAVGALAQFARTMADDHGHLPRIGDDDGGSLFPIAGRDPSDASDSLQLAAHLIDRPDLSAGAPAEELAWMIGETAVSRPPTVWPSAALPETGYFVSRFARGDHLAIDAGRHGFLNGGHAHADALAVTLSVRGLPFLIDPGTACYTIDLAMRDRFRSTSFHNTVTVDERSQSIPDGPFHWKTSARATALYWRADREFDFFEGRHDGYAPTRHQRAVLARPGCWFIFDRIAGQGRHRADAHWHLDREWSANRSGRHLVRAEHPDGTTVWIASLDGNCELFRGSCDASGLGWCSPAYGQIIPTIAVRFSLAADGPLSFVTVIIESMEPPSIERLTVRIDDQESHDAIAFRLTTQDWTETVMFTRWLSIPKGDRLSQSMWTAGGLVTDARLLCWREDARGAGASVLLDGTMGRLNPPELALAARDIG
jgi:Heparinase II/III-like protein/Heparinase II/III N-terminus